jgi:ABC-2 type transport system permease protein
MTTLVASEFMKLRTVRSWWLLLACQQALVLAAIGGIVLVGANLHDPTMERKLLAQAGFVSSLLSLILGILAVAGEYRHKTITDTYLATPRRGRVILAKLLAYTLVGAGCGTVSAIVALSVAVTVLAARGIGVDLTGAEAWRSAGGVVGANALYAAMGVSLGTLVRNTTGAVTIALVWIFLVEGIVSSLLGAPSEWLPNASLLALAYSPGRMAASAGLLPQWAGAVVLAGYATVLAALATGTSVQRDVT